jgi:hypothetical protein
MQRDLADVSFEAAAADATSSRTVLLDEQLGTGPAIRGPGNPYDCGECAAAAARGQLGDPLEDLRGLAPVFHRVQ